MVIDREWAMPNKNTFSIKPINKLISEEIVGGGMDRPIRQYQ